MTLLRVPCTVILIALYIQPTLCSADCSDPLSISAAEGENVILHINETGVEEISWIQNGAHIASVLGKTFSVKDPKSRTRFQGTVQGSLKIVYVRMKDQGEYSASVTKEKEKDCVQIFTLKVYPKLLKEDIEIKVNVSGDETCNLTCTVNKPDVRISWNNQSENNTDVINPTLQLYNIHPNDTYSCTAENPVIRISRSIQPWSFCQKETGVHLAHQANSQSIWIPIVVVLMIILLPGALLIRKKIQDSGKTNKNPAASSSSPQV